MNINERSLTFHAQVVIDGKGHLLGRLASIVAKQLLNGQKVVVVRCEALNISGEFFRAKRTSSITLAGGLANPHKPPEPENASVQGRADIPHLYSQVPCLSPKDDPIQPHSRWSLPFPRPSPYLLQDSPRHGATQDPSRRSRYGETEGL